MLDRLAFLEMHALFCKEIVVSCSQYCKLLNLEMNWPQKQSRAPKHGDGDGDGSIPHASRSGKSAQRDKTSRRMIPNDPEKSPGALSGTAGTCGFFRSSSTKSSSSRKQHMARSAGFHRRSFSDELRRKSFAANKDFSPSVLRSPGPLSGRSNRGQPVDNVSTALFALHRPQNFSEETFPRMIIIWHRFLTSIYFPFFICLTWNYILEGPNDAHDLSFKWQHFGVTLVPVFGDWDETDPNSGEGYTERFSRIKEEKENDSSNFQPMLSIPISHSDSPTKQRLLSYLFKVAFRSLFQKSKLIAPSWYLIKSTLEIINIRAVLVLVHDIGPLDLLQKYRHVFSCGKQ